MPRIPEDPKPKKPLKKARGKACIACGGSGTSRKWARCPICRGTNLKEKQ